MKTPDLLFNRSRTVFRLAGVLTLYAVVICHGDGTRALYSDQGLYSGDSDQPNSLRMDIYTWADSQVVIDASVLGGPETPEGLTILTANVNRNWGGYGFFHVAVNNSAVVEEYDYSAYKNGAVRFWLRSDSGLQVEIEFLTPTGVMEKVGAIAMSTGNVWKEIVIPLSSFAGPTDLNLKRIRGPFLITATGGSGPKNWAVDHVRWTKAISSMSVFPTNAQVAAGGHLQLTVEGQTASGEAVLAYPTLTVMGTNGTLEPAAPKPGRSFVFTAGPIPGDVAVTAAVDTGTPTAVQTNLALHIIPSQEYVKYGLLSESALVGVNLDNDSKLLAFPGDESVCKLETVFDDFTEGQKSLRTTVNLKGQDAFCGWTIQWGLEGSSDSETIDRSSFYDGNLTFAIKGPSHCTANCSWEFDQGMSPQAKS